MNIDITTARVAARLDGLRQEADERRLARLAARAADAPQGAEPTHPRPTPRASRFPGWRAITGRTHS